MFTDKLKKILGRITLKQLVLIIIPLLSIVLWSSILFIFFNQIVNVNIDRYETTQKRLIDSFARSSYGEIKLGEYTQLKRSISSIDFGSQNTAVGFVDNAGDIVLADSTDMPFLLKILNSKKQISNLGNEYKDGGKSYFVFTRKVLDKDTGGLLGTVFSFIDDTAYRTREAVLKRKLIVLALAVLILQLLATLFIVNKLVRPIEDFVNKWVKGADYRVIKDKLKSDKGFYTKDLISASDAMANMMARYETEAAMGRLTSQIAHDMRSPLTTVKACIETDWSDFEPDEARMYRDSGVRCVARLTNMAEELLNYSRSGTISRSRSDLARMIRNVMMDIRSSKIKPGVKIDYDGPDQCEADLDEPKMTSVIDNIFVNACQAISDNGNIVVKLDGVKKDVINLSIADNGVGIEDGDLDKIFNSTYTKGKTGGLGLGLAYCKNVVDAHGGDIVVKSKKSFGTTFTISIPRRTS